MSDHAETQGVLDKVRPHLGTFGITRVANVTGLDRLGVPVYMVCRPNSKSLAVFQGKGISENAAKISGIMEAVECFHAENLSTPILKDSFNHLSLGTRMNLARLSRLKDRIFYEDNAMQWIHGHDLISGHEKMVPHQSVHMDCTVHNAEPQIFISDTTGLAAGDTMIHAVNHGLYENIERDALALWSLTKLDKKFIKKIKLRDIKDDFILSFLDRCDDADTAVAAWDITTDIGIPSFVCKIMARDYVGNGVRPAFGSGTHISPLVALQKAVTEAAQSRITFIAGARDDQYAYHYQSQLSLDTYNRWHREVVEQKEHRDLTDIQDHSYSIPDGDQAYILDSLALQGLDEVVAVDLSKPEFGISVAKTLIPGLEGVSFSGQRLIGERGRYHLSLQEGHA